MSPVLLHRGQGSLLDLTNILKASSSSMNLLHVQEIADLGAVDRLAKQLLLTMTSTGVGKTSLSRREKWLEILSIAEGRVQMLGRTPHPSSSAVPIIQLDARAEEAPTFER